MNEEIFRKKSLDRINSPESLNDYIRVTTPGLWILLSSIIILLIGVTVWGVLGRIDVWDDVKVEASQNEVVCYAESNLVGKIGPGTKITVNDFAGTVSDEGKYDDGNGMYRYTLNLSIPDGVYDGRVLTESIKPKSLIFN